MPTLQIPDQPFLSDASPEEAQKFKALLSWFYSQEYRPFISEAHQYAKTLGINRPKTAIKAIVHRSIPPKDAPVQRWKSSQQQAGAAKKGLGGHGSPNSPQPQGGQQHSTGWTSKKGFKGFQKVNPPDPTPRQLPSRHLPSRQLPSRRQTLDSATPPTMTTDKYPAVPPARTTASPSMNKGPLPNTVWEMVCQDKFIDPKQSGIPPICAETAASKPVRRIIENEDAHQLGWRGRSRYTTTDITALILHATGRPAKKTCRLCTQGTGPFEGCIVSTDDDPQAERYNHSCSNCWFGGRANECELRPKHKKKFRSRKGIWQSGTRASKRSFDEAFSRESSPDLDFPDGEDEDEDEDDHNGNTNGNINNAQAGAASFLISDILPKRIKELTARSSLPGPSKSTKTKSRHSLPASASASASASHPLRNRNHQYSLGGAEPDAEATAMDVDQEEYEGSDHDAVPDNRQQTKPAVTETPVNEENDNEDKNVEIDMNQDHPLAEAGGEVAENPPPLELDDLSTYLNHYLEYYRNMSKDGRSQARVLRNLEITAIDALQAAKL